MEEKKKKLVGKITHYFTGISVAVVELENKLKVGDKVLIKGATTSFEQDIDSLQIHNQPVESAKKSESVGLKVKEKVREGDSVYKA